jgi:hypothetical protein
MHEILDHIVTDDHSAHETTGWVPHGLKCAGIRVTKSMVAQSNRVLVEMELEVQVCNLAVLFNRVKW